MGQFMGLAQVARDLEQRRLGQVWRIDELVAVALVFLARIVLHQLAHKPALGMKNSQPAADLGREMEQVELHPEPAVVAPLRLL
jgi:hypothetical protein